tara:strand:- start:140 stop:382 length:243 start_codon:yes stop_codon:yes gene_type:complete
MIESLGLEEIVRLVDFIMISSARGQYLWRTQIRRMLRCPGMDNRKYSEDTLQWVLKREIKIKELHHQGARGGKDGTALCM